MTKAKKKSHLYDLSVVELKKRCNDEEKSWRALDADWFLISYLLDRLLEVIKFLEERLKEEKEMEDTWESDHKFQR